MEQKESLRLQQEINYYKNMISSHKRSTSKHNLHRQNFQLHRNKYASNNNIKLQPTLSRNPSPTKSLQKPNHNFGKSLKVNSTHLSKLSSMDRVTNNQLRRGNLNLAETRVTASAKYKWNSLQPSAKNLDAEICDGRKNRQSSKNISISSSLPTSQNFSFSNKSTIHKTSTSDRLTMKRKLDSLSTKTTGKSQFKWSKNTLSNHTSASNPVLSRTGINLKSEALLSANSSKSIHQSLDSRAKAQTMKKLVNKYKLFRDTNRRYAVNISSNPYKVIKDRSSSHNSSLFNKRSIQRYRRESSKRSHYFNRLQHRHYVNVDKYRGKHAVYRKKSFVTNNRYKLVRLPVQTRSRKSGNIVLKRKQLQSQTPKNKFTFSKYGSTSTAKQRLASHALHRSIEMARSKNRHKIKKVFCIFYNRFGKCNRGDKCPYTHDPERVAICTQFLRGTCRNMHCVFSHQVSMHKMPVCSFFLRGKCSTKNCPYLHVFVGHTAPVCRNFSTTGYCFKADNCKELHIRACPDFYANGKCSRGNKCSLPHKQRRKPQSTSGSLPSNPSTESSPRKPSQSDQSTSQRGVDFIRLPKKPLSAPTQDSSSLISDAGSTDMRIQPRLKLKPSFTKRL